MMPPSRNEDVLVDAARMFYLEGRSQIDIARTLGLSASSVSRILSAAREQGVVEVRIHDPRKLARVPELEEAIRREFGIEAPAVVSRRRREPPTRVVARAAARLFEDRVTGLASFGLSWGNTVRSFVDEVQVEPIHSALRISPMVGGMPSDTGPAGNTSLEVLAEKCGAVSFRFESPAVVESRATWHAMNSESSILGAISRAAQVEVAFVGIGSYGLHNSGRVIAAMHLSDEEAAQVAAQRPAGDICGRFYDLHGNALDLPTSERVIGVTLQLLSKVPLAVGIAGGVEKAPGVVGALRTRALDGIIVDEDLARAVLNIADEH